MKSSDEGLLKSEKGVALPVAIFGLVAVSLLVTSALVTSSTEIALSQAHQDGTRALYEVDGALEEFVGQRAGMVTNTDTRFADGSYGVSSPSGDAHQVNVAQLYEGPVVPQPDGSMQRSEMYSLVAEAASGVGRAVGALVEVTRNAIALSFNVESGLTLGTNGTVAGSATISDGSSSDGLSPGAACDSASASAAILHADGTNVTQQGNGHAIFGAIIEDDRGAAELAEYILNGQSLDDLSNLAHIKFGPMFGEPMFLGSPNQANANVDYRWGCPAALTSGCGSSASAYYPTVVIDANGGEANLTGDHGQGIMLIRNGGIHIRGNFEYAGIIIVEGTLRVTGTPTIEGGVIALGDNTVIDPGDGSSTSGNSVIRFNKCEIVEAQRGLTIQSLDTSEQMIDRPTFAWFEVIR